MIITDNNFKELITSSIESSDNPFYVLVDFWGESCTPCKRLADILDEVEKEENFKIKIYKMNISEHPETSSEFCIRAIPTLILFKDGREIGRKVGFTTKEAVIQWIDKFLII